MIRKNIFLSILLLSTLTLSIPVNAQEQLPDITQIEQSVEVTQEVPPMGQAAQPQTEQQEEVESLQIVPQISLIQYSYISSCNAVLSISGSGVVNANAYIAGYPSTTTQIVGYLNLEHLIGDSWVTERSWYESDASAYLNINKSTNVSVHGAYRLRLVGYVYSGSSYEQITKYSSPFTY